LGAVILLLASAEILMNMTPPFCRDGLIHHLAIPKLWLKHGGIYEIPWADFSYYPMNINLLYYACLYFNNDVAPKFIHMFFGLGTGYWVYIYLKKRFDFICGLLGALIFISTPIVVWLSTSVYIDLGMTFFTTASVLSLINWRDSGYRRLLWLIVSSICMGIAVGSKYNALIAWCILNLMVVLIYVRDTRRQLSSIKFGLLYFCVTALVASPWYVKNFLLTGNPFYPLFNNYLNLFGNQPVKEIIENHIVNRPARIGFFQLRHVLYGESFSETLLIPIRMFFQGDDNSYQYFQGRLNPILILFAPFVLLKKTNAKDHLIFALFSIFFIIVAYFTTEKQVRYILPVLPFLSILAVAGIKNLDDKLKEYSFFLSSRQNGSLKTILRIVMLYGISVLLMMNLVYIKKRFEDIKPVGYILKKESKDEFLSRLLSHYDTVKFVNANLPEDAVVFTIFFGRRGYYFDREYKNDPQFGTGKLGELVKTSSNEDDFDRTVKSIGATHIIIRQELADRYLDNNFSEMETKRFFKMVKRKWKLLYDQNGFSVWEVARSTTQTGGHK
jgi:hypothetical protein